MNLTCSYPNTTTKSIGWNVMEKVRGVMKAKFDFDLLGNSWVSTVNFTNDLYVSCYVIDARGKRMESYQAQFIVQKPSFSSEDRQVDVRHENKNAYLAEG